jgi:hypothetical protein
VDQLRGDGRRKGEAHRRKAVRDEDRVRFVGGEHPADPQLVEPDVRDEDVPLPQRSPKLDEDPGWLQRRSGVVVGATQALAHGISQSRGAGGV